MTDYEIITVVQAHADGRQVQCRLRDGTCWTDANPDWNFSTCDYRVKPEPREWTLCSGVSGEDWQIAPASHGNCSGERVHVREVLP